MIGYLYETQGRLILYPTLATCSRTINTDFLQVKSQFLDFCITNDVRAPSHPYQDRFIHSTGFMQPLETAPHLDAFVI